MFWSKFWKVIVLRSHHWIPTLLPSHKKTPTCLPPLPDGTNPTRPFHGNSLPCAHGIHFPSQLRFVNWLPLGADYLIALVPSAMLRLGHQLGQPFGREPAVHPPNRPVDHIGLPRCSIPLSPRAPNCSRPTHIQPVNPVQPGAHLRCSLVLTILRSAADIHARAALGPFRISASHRPPRAAPSHPPLGVADNPFRQHTKETPRHGDYSLGFLLPFVRVAYERPPSPRPTGHASPIPYFEVLYFLQYFPRMFLPASGTRLGLSSDRREWIETMAQSIGLIVEPSFDDPRLPACVGVDREVSRIDTTRRIPGALETTCGMVAACRH